MKKLFTASHRSFPSNPIARMALALVFTVFLALGFWVATLPAAHAARTMTPVEMIQEGLPPGRTLGTATKPEVLSAVCAAVKRHRPEAPAITEAAVAAHKNYAGDIVATVLRCSPSVNCAFVGTIVSSAILSAPDEASTIDDAALALAPDCADAIQNATERARAGDVAEGPAGFSSEGPSNQVPLPGSAGGGGGAGFNPQEQLVLVCDNGTERRVRESQLADFLGSHPGAFVGSCQPTPTTNQ